MKNRYMMYGLGLGVAGAGLLAVSMLGLVAMVIGSLLLAFGLGVDQGRRERWADERIELDRLFEDSLQSGRLASFVDIPESALREMASLGAERFRVSGPLEKPERAPDLLEPRPDTAAPTSDQA
ncbi:MAG: hypothetical protein WCO00_06450 [Rhodospirillaceae bacterium]